MIIESYLNLLFEQLMKNAPTFIYEILHGKKPPTQLRGRTVTHKKKIIDGIEIDAGIPTSVIKKLNNIKEIEMRSSCQGESEERPSFIIFRLNKNIDIKKFVKKLNNKKDIKAGFDLGNQGRYRIGVTWWTWYGKKGNTEWWESLPKKIIDSLK